MKRSKKIALVIIASVTLTSCGSNTQQTQRDVYSTKEQCADDWGDKDCEDAGTSGSSGGHYFMGPHYYAYGGRSYYFPRGSSGSSEPVQATSLPRFKSGLSRASGVSRTISSSVSRGGFGHFARGGS
jgi:hypothetical protein